MAKKIQILYIHGGMTFKTNSKYIDYLKTRTIYLKDTKFWPQEYMQKKLEDIAIIISPKMPRKENAKYKEWKINFERYLEVLEDNIILVSWSLGGIFLAKYLSENKIDKNIISTYIIAAPFSGSIQKDDLYGGFYLKQDLSLIEQNCNNINIWFSKDDPIIPIAHAKKYEKNIPSAKIKLFENKNGHFLVTKFPELIRAIKKDLKK